MSSPLFARRSLRAIVVSYLPAVPPTSLSMSAFILLVESVSLVKVTSAEVSPV